MTILYKSASGREVTHASSSAIDQFKQCRRKFRLSRVDGWKQKGRKASLEFGKAVEQGIRYYHENGLKPDDGIDTFKSIWLKWKDQDLIYTAQEEKWEDLYGMGAAFLRLYEIFLPTLPIRNPKFELNFKKEVWPGHATLAGLEFTAFVDMLSTLEDGSRIIVDIKTGKNPLDPTPNMISMDGQLRKYAWCSGFADVAFLWFVKAKPSLKKSDRVTLLQDTLEWKAGQELTVYKFMEAPETDPMTEAKVVVGTAESVQLMEDTCEAIKGKGSTEAKNQVFADLLSSGKFTIVSRDKVTKCRLQFVRGKIPAEEISEIGQQIGQDMYAMKASNDDNFYPQDGGVKFPNTACLWCEQRGHCLKRPDLVEQLLVKIGPAVKEDDWLLELEEATE